MEPSPEDATSLLDGRASGDRGTAAQLALHGYKAVPLMLAFLLLTLVTAARPLFAQTTVGTGSLSFVSRFPCSREWAATTLLSRRGFGRSSAILAKGPESCGVEW